MAQLGITFTADPNAPKTTFDTIPAGEYVAQIVESEIKTTGQHGTGLMASLTWEIMEGQHKGRKFWYNINYKNDSEKAQRIGQGQLNDLQVALGVPAIDDTNQLHMKPARVKLKVTPPKDGYNERNDVVAVNPWAPGAPTAGGAPGPAATGATSPFAGAPTAPNASGKPW
jgi:Protein of unknown function (DUF669)